ncbi:universal stress protein [Nocardioides euryhalodurans]|nr:universal stress protein [Nocardioides euryhalodurans]
MDDELVGGVVVGTDGSAQGGAALEYGVREAQRRGTSLTVVHVATDYVPVAPMMPLVPEDLKALGRTILDEALQTVTGLVPELDVRTVLRSGAAVPELVRVSAEASVLVLGHEMTPAWQRLFTGAVTVGVAEQARCPVVTVPTAWEPAAARREVVVGLKSLEHAPGLLSHAVATAADRGSSLTVVHTWELPVRYDDIIVRRTHETDWNRAARDRVVPLVEEARASHPEVEVAVRVEHAQAAAVLRNASASCELLVLGRRTRGPAVLHLGGTGRALLHAAECPVEIVPPVRAEEQARRPVHAHETSS